MAKPNDQTLWLNLMTELKLNLMAKPKLNIMVKLTG